MTAPDPAPLGEKARALAARLIRNSETAPREHETREPLYEWSCARLAVGTAAQKLGASVDTLAPGKMGCPYHYHLAQEELFVVLEGAGTLHVAGERLPLRRGDVVFVPPGPEYPHQIINTSDAPLTYLSVSTKESPECVFYPDSNKFAVMSRAEGAHFSFVQRPENGLDYWDGEP